MIKNKKRMFGVTGIILSCMIVCGSQYVYGKSSNSFSEGFQNLIETGCGRFDGNIYTNEMFGIQYTLSDGMSFLSEEEIISVNGFVNEELEEVTDFIDVEDDLIYTDMGVRNNVSGANISVSLSYDSDWSEWVNQNYYEMQVLMFEEMEEMQEESGLFDGEVEISLEKTEFLGEEVTCLVTHTMMNGRDYCIRQVTMCKEGNRAVIVASAENDEKTAEIIASIERVARGTHEIPVTERIVREVQEKLNLQGIECGTADGIFGNMTREAIQKYQVNMGMAVNGMITNELLERLGITGKVIERIPVELNNIYYEFNDTGTGYITIYFDNLTNQEYKAIKIYFQLFDREGNLLGEEFTYTMNAKASRIIQGNKQIPYTGVDKIAVYKYGTKDVQGGEETEYILSQPLSYTIEEIESGKAKKKSTFVSGTPLKNEGVNDFETLKTALSCIGTNIQELPVDIWGMSCSLYGYMGYFSGLLDIDESLEYLLWNLNGAVDVQLLNEILGEMETLYGMYDEEYSRAVAETHYTWNDINGYSMTLRYTPEEEQQLCISWGDASKEADWLIIG